MWGSYGACVTICVWTDGWKYVGILGGLQGRVPGTVRYFDKVHDWVKVACVYVSVSVSVSVNAKRNWNIHWNAVSTQSIDNACVANVLLMCC